MAKEQDKVFYSWQADLPASDHRNFIEKALKGAIKAINRDGSFLNELILDRDTKGVSGAPLIAEVIFGKVNDSAMFVADVTFIGHADSGKPVINSNVAIEVGYALHALPDSALILILNQAYGKIEDLPFDLKHRRVMTYKLSLGASSSERAQAAEELQQDLTKALRLFLGTRPVESVEPVLSPVEQLEEYLLDPNAGRRAIRLIETEADKLADVLDAISVSEMAKDESVDGVYKLIQVYESQTADLLDVFVKASYEADPLITDALVKALYRIAHIERLPHRVGNAHLYPALLLLYGGGTAALAGNKVATLISLIRDVRIADGSKTYPAAYQLVPYRVLPETVAKELPPVKAHYVPISDHLFDALREPLRRVIKVDRQYYECFLRFEYLLALASASANQKFGSGGVHAPVGSYLWERTLREKPYILEVTDEELKRQKEAWPPFKEGIYEGTYEEFLLFKQQVDESIKSLVALFYF